MYQVVMQAALTLRCAGSNIRVVDSRLETKVFQSFYLFLFERTLHYSC